ncbi:hypothetical protein SNE40_007371 [Patella caerulea]|uniref:NADPH oxidase 5 n=1 Tax=Patella caerulea TaxID=87958 RepID=A0AAN8JYC9_PATCE
MKVLDGMEKDCNSTTENQNIPLEINTSEGEKTLNCKTDTVGHSDQNGLTQNDPESCQKSNLEDSVISEEEPTDSSTDNVINSDQNGPSTSESSKKSNLRDSVLSNNLNLNSIDGSSEAPKRENIKRRISWVDSNASCNSLEPHSSTLESLQEIAIDMNIAEPEDSKTKIKSKEITKMDEITEMSSRKTKENKKSNGNEHKLNGDAINSTMQDSHQSDVRWLQWVQEQFRNMAGNDTEINYKKFKSALKVKESFFAEKFFEFFDKDGDGNINLFELMDGLRMLTRGSTTDKIRFLFNIYDIDGNGHIDIDELKTVLESCVQESSIKMSDFDIDRLTEVLFDSADTDGTGQITFEKLEAVLTQHPEVLENLTISAAQWLKPGDTAAKKKRELPRYLQGKYIRNNLKKIIFYIIYFLANIGLYAYGAYNYRQSNPAIIIARGSGMCLNFNCMFILVLMLRKCITFLRSWQWAYSILPLDQHILFHKTVGIMIAVHSAIHTFGHIGNAVIVEKSDVGLTAIDVIFTTKAGLGWVAGTAPLTGVVLVVILIVMVICSMSFVRRSGHFEVFYYTHMLYIPFWILTIIHAGDFWKWFIVPGIIFFFESILRSKPMKLATHGRTFIKEVNLLPSGVTHLVISRPANFDFKPGDYLFIQIPVLAKSEWHPFTISSAPEMDGFLWLHIRSAGHWTKSLYEYMEKYGTDVSNKQSIKGTINKAFHDGLDKIERGIKEGSFKRRTTKHNRKSTVRRRKDTSKKVHIEVYLDGPYGTSTREIFQTEHAVLIGAGIGITPFASILQSIIYRFNAMERTCPSCKHLFTEPAAGSMMKLKKVDFVWINRDQKSFEWFTSLLTQLELEQVKQGGHLDTILDLHMYMTAAVQKADMKGIGLQVALDLIHEKEQRDLLTGLRTRTKPGRPDFNELFKSIASKKQGKVKVYFCGAPVVAKTIKEYCEKFKFGFRKENF